MIRKNDELPNPSTINRYVGLARMLKDNDGNVEGPSHEAFAVRPNESYLSVTWADYFEGNPDKQLRCGIEAIRSSNYKPAPRGYYCVAITADIRATAYKFGIMPREVYLPEDDNPAHAGVYGISIEDRRLHEELASETWSRFLSREMADALPLMQCTKAANIE